jgi:hypothetical protein
VAISSGLVHGQEDEMIAALFFARLCVPLRGLIIGNNPSQTKLCFLVAEDSTGRMWARGILYITLLYVPFCCVLSYKDHLKMMLQHGFFLVLSVVSALLSFLFLLDTCLFVRGCDLIWASTSATFHVF